MSEAIVSEGAVLKRGDGASPEVFTEVSEVVDFDGPGGQGSVIDVTHLKSTRREKRMGLPDEGQVTLTLNHIPTDTMQTGLRSDRANRTLRNFKLELPDSPVQTLSFSAYVLGYSISGGVDAPVRASVVLEITGEVTYA